jgi:hypothetical protein
MTTRIACLLGLLTLLGCGGEDGALRKTLSAQDVSPALVVNAADVEAIADWARNGGLRPELVIVLADNAVREIDASGHVDLYVQVPGRVCVAEGNIEGISDGEREFEAFIFQRVGYSNWEQGEPAEGVESGRQVEWSFNRVIPSTGAWHFVVSNRFSDESPKTVRVSAKVTCPGNT